jgi:hypothetical protein
MRDRMPERGRRRAVVALAALVLGGAAAAALLLGRGGPTPRPRTAAVAPGPLPAPTGTSWGASVNRLFENPALTPTAAVQLAALAATGATLARSDALWEETEPAAPVAGQHHYAWEFDDATAAALAVHHLRWLPILDYSPGWAQSVPGQDHSPPRSAFDYAAYAAAFAARYGPGGTFWSEHPALPAEPVDAIEIWNEPDNGTFWFPHPDPAAYAQLFVAARDAIRAASPGVRVVIGGLTAPLRFLPAILHAQPSISDRLDGVAIHPYGPSPLAVAAHVIAARRLMRGLGIGAVPLYVTEFGWTTSPPGAHDYLPESARPAALSATLALLGRLRCGLAAVVLYTWVSERQDPSSSAQWFGISPPGGGASADTRAFTSGLAAGMSPTGPSVPC